MYLLSWVAGIESYCVYVHSLSLSGGTAALRRAGGWRRGGKLSKDGDGLETETVLFSMLLRLVLQVVFSVDRD